MLHRAVAESLRAVRHALGIFHIVGNHACALFVNEHGLQRNGIVAVIVVLDGHGSIVQRHQIAAHQPLGRLRIGGHPLHLGQLDGVAVGVPDVRLLGGDAVAEGGGALVVHFPGLGGIGRRHLAGGVSGHGHHGHGAQRRCNGGHQHHAGHTPDGLFHPASLVLFLDLVHGQLLYPAEVGRAAG